MWSLWAELAANIIWFAVIRCGRRWMPWFGSAMLAAFLFLAWRHKTLGDGFQQSAAMLLFALVSALAWFSVGYAIGLSKFIPVVRVPILLIALSLVLVLLERGTEHPWIVELAAVSVSALLLHALLHAPPPARPVARLGRWLGLLSYPLYLIHLPAGRLLPYFDVAMPHWSAFLLVICVAGVAATFLNEITVDYLHQAYRRRARIERDIEAG
jgi:peptidoglycan/LPS O-acetylase OafA/YrhL